MPTLTHEDAHQDAAGSDAPGAKRKIQLELDEDVYLRLKLVSAKGGKRLGAVASDAMRAGLPAVHIAPAPGVA
jgi:hypothetical protein